jgi:large subunit ribosomal protein L1
MLSAESAVGKFPEEAVATLARIADTTEKARPRVRLDGGPTPVAKNAGADFVGAEDLVQKIQGGWLDFDKAIATPDMMATVSKVAKVLGPRGLMPNPKVGTVTMNVGEAVASEKKGKLDFRIDKAGIVHAGIGRKSMGEAKLRENFMSLMGAIAKAKPATSKGIYLKSITVSSTMGPGVKVDVSAAGAEQKE